MPVPVHCEWTTSASINEVLRRVRQKTEPLDGGFTLMHRLSGAGIVVRTLRAPETSRPFFGTVYEDRFHIALVPSPTDVTPFHPIARVQLSETPSGATKLSAELAHHPNARSFALIYLLGGATLGIGTVVATPEQPAILFGGLGLALLFAVFPSLQARLRFEQSVERLKQRLSEHFNLDTSE
ncbi:MAG: hypothetical protein CL927_06480 [Deltaproteobacteria bacterium]|nr:hypothetical protein [Deltaproteobacteria bacterium]HCH63921.1 hypothetical protein [Deltaproteobacteria bacterium]